MRSEADVCYLHIPPIPPFNMVEMKVCQVATLAYPSLPSYHTLNSGPELPEVTANLLPRFDRLLSSQVAVLELLSQLTRRLYCLDRRIAECIAAGRDAGTVGTDNGQNACELDAVLVSFCDF